MPLTKLQFRPGINKETTSYSNEGGWYECDKVRFRFGVPEKIGGWEHTFDANFLGTCRSLIGWTALDGNNFIGVGTHLKYYISEGGAYYDITPIRSTTAAGEVTFDASANTLASDVSAGDTSITLTSASGFPSVGIIQIESETISYNGISSNDLTNCVRGLDGTTDAAHSSGAAVNCSTIKVADTGHGCNPNDFVTFSGAATLGGQATANRLNQEYQIFTLVDENNYTITLRDVATVDSITSTTGYAPTIIFANSSDTGNGGSSVVGAYQVPTGQDTVVFGTGWGAGTWGRGTWGSAASIGAADRSLRTWSHDNFGEDLVINPRDAGIYYWDRTNGVTTRAVDISSAAFGTTFSPPVVAKQVLVSDRDKHVIAFGTNPESDTTQDPLLIRFCDQGNIRDWETTVTNTAGDLLIGTGSEIVTAVETRQQILVFTDVSVHSMQFLGPPFTFGINLISDNITIRGNQTAINVEDSVYWMGQNEFYMFNGAVNRLACTVRDYVFSDFNDDQAGKVIAGSNAAFGEVWWFYPSANSADNDRYVVYNYQQNIWYYGNLGRSAWMDRGTERNPIAASTDHYLYFHEFGDNDGSENPPVAINSYIESSQVSIGEGDNFVFVRRLIPDVTFRSSTGTPDLSMTIKARRFPGSNYDTSNTATVSQTATVPIEEFTDQAHIRVRGRSFAVRVESNQTDVTWRLGTPRVDVRPDGRR
tara:strand:- start:734 stop:2848 length:2115 start_codon:yes stop_codon:yes gene_type:complete